MNIDEAIDAIYDDKAGRFRPEFLERGEPATADNLPRKGDLVQQGGEPFITNRDWSPEHVPRERPATILRRKEQPEPMWWYICDYCEALHEDGRPTPSDECQGDMFPLSDLIYFPWPSGIDGIIGVIGPRGDIPEGTRYREFSSGRWVEGREFMLVRQTMGGASWFRFPADADLTWVRDESEVPKELLREARERDA